jgi:hypothetical protein
MLAKSRCAGASLPVHQEGAAVDRPDRDQGDGEGSRSANGTDPTGAAAYAAVQSAPAMA